MRLHLELLADLLGTEKAVRDFRKHASWYVTGFPVGTDVRRRLSQIGSAAELESIFAELDPATPFPPEARRIKRGHTRGPRPVSLPDRWLETADDPAKPDWRVISARGTVLAKQGSYREAIPLYERALSLAPDQPSILNNLALAQAMQGHADRAESLLRRAAAADGKDITIGGGASTVPGATARRT